jgi:hypothetical protein
MEDCFYSDPITLVDGIAFSPRQMDIISCMLNGLVDKEIEGVLGISVDTIRTHIRNLKKDPVSPKGKIIPNKKRFSSRNEIKKYITSSSNHRQIKERYIDILIFSKFQETLKKIKKSEISPKYRCMLHAINVDTVNKYILLNYLKSAGVDVKILCDLEECGDHEFHIICCSERSKINLQNLNLDNIVVSKNHYNNVIDLSGKCIEAIETGGANTNAILVYWDASRKFIAQRK